MGNALKQEIVLAEFPQDGRLWLVSRIGDIVYNRESDENRATIVLAPLASNFGLASRRSFPDLLRDAAKQVEIGAGMLSEILVGSIYRNGKPVQVPEGYAEKLYFWINDVRRCATCTQEELVKMGFGIPLLGDTLASQSLYAVYERGDNKWLQGITHVLLPHSEIARFYYFDSSVLAKLMTNGGVLNGQLYTLDYDKLGAGRQEEIREWAREGIEFMLLHDWIPEGSIPTVAKLRFNQEAHDSALAIHSTLYSGFTQANGRAPLQARFPFTGVTKINVYGCKVGHGNAQAFLVCEIAACSKQFLWRPFKYNWVTDRRRELSGGEKTQVTGRKGRHTVAARKEGDVVADTAEGANSGATRLGVEGHARPGRFNIDASMMERAPKDGLQAGGVKSVRKETGFGKFTTDGKSDSLSKAGGMDIYAAQQDNESKQGLKESYRDKYIGRFAKAVEKLKQHGYSIQSISIGNTTRERGGLKMTLFPVNQAINTEVKNWAHLNRYAQGKKNKPRGVAIVEITKDLRFWYASEIEPRAENQTFSVAVFATDGFSQLSISKLDVFLALVMNQEGMHLHRLNGKQGLQVKAVDHLSGDFSEAGISELAKRMLKALKG
jgi:hypothetical protein